MTATWDDGAASLLELAGHTPRQSSHIADTMRSVGYLGLMLNIDEFYQAAIWASNMIDRYDQFSRPMIDKIVIPIDLLIPKNYDKKVIINSFYLLIVYYHRKGNKDLVETLAGQLMNVAKFQPVKKKDIKIMEMWEDYLSDMKHKLRLGDFSAADGHSLEGTKKIYDHYVALVEKERKSFRNELCRENGLVI